MTATLSKTLIDLESVNVVLDGVTILEDIQFSIREGECWAILGRNGSGKSTLLRLIRGDQWPDPGSRGRRLYCFEGAPEESCIGNRERIAIVSAETQERYARRPYQQKAERFVKAGCFDAFYLPNTLDEDLQCDYDYVVELLGIGHLMDKRFQEMSQGEQRKVLIARALIAKPKLLLLDEMTNGLDRDSRESIMELIARMAREGTPIIFTTHRMDEIFPEITHIAVMENRRIDRQGERDDVLPEITRVQDEAAQHQPVTTAAPESTEAETTPVITVRNADVFIGRKQILHDISIDIYGHENWALVGPNGSGKTTFLKLIYGAHHPALGGEIARFDLAGNTSIRIINAQFGYVGAELQARYHFDMTALEVVVSGFYASIGLFDNPIGEQMDAGRSWLKKMGLADLAERSITFQQLIASPVSAMAGSCRPVRGRKS